MPAPRTAFIHIGLPKTGTTAIQAAFSQARAALAAAGYHYLSGDPNHGERLALAFWDKEDALRLAGLRWKDGDAAQAHRAEARAELAREIEASAPRHLILSAEELSAFRQSEVARCLQFLRERLERIRVVAYLRDPLDWATSASQQAVTWSGDLLDDLFDHPRLPQFEARLSPWRAAIGTQDMTFRAHDRADAVADFSEVIGLRNAPEFANRQNAAVSHRTATLFSRFNALRPPFVEARHSPCRSFDVVRDGRLPGRRFDLPLETVETHAPALAAERDWANEALAASVFKAPALPLIGRDAWYAGERGALDDFAAVFLEKARLAQNEHALRMHLKARRHRDKAALAISLLDQAWLLATDRWTMDALSQEALEQDRDDREKFFAKARLMRRITAPEPGDPPLVIGNPYDRPWSRAVGFIGPKISPGVPGAEPPGGSATKSPEPLV